MARENQAAQKERERTAPAKFNRNNPPVTRPRRFTLKVQKAPHVEVALFVQVLADGVAEDSWVMGQTSFSLPRYNYPACKYTSTGQISAFNGPFEWMGAYTIQVRYASGVSPRELSCYGRGTTEQDIADGNTTLGFHESCHIVDYLEYLEITRMPELPELWVGMHIDEYHSEQKRFDSQYRVFHEGMEQFSEYRTDEVGYRQSHWKATGRCFNWRPD